MNAGVIVVAEAAWPSKGRLESCSPVPSSAGQEEWAVTPVPTTSAKMALVAMGRADAAVRLAVPAPGVAPWDYAAAALIVKEAGGTVRDDRCRDLAASLPAPVAGWLACLRPEHAGPLHHIMTTGMRRLGNERSDAV